MTKDKQAIQKMAEDKYPGLEYTKSIFVTGYTAAVEDMEKEAVGFAEWIENNHYTLDDKFWYNNVNQVKRYTTADLLTLYRESIKK